jgi:predicted methyltransferase
MSTILSSKTIRTISEHIQAKKKVTTVSLDLGLTTTTIPLTDDGIIIDDRTYRLPKIKKKDRSCYLLKDSGFEKMQYISEETGQLYKLVPTTGRPILKISATPMHKKPFVDRIAHDKLKGTVLDSGTGLGYTAVEIERTADHVTTVEHDKTVIDIARHNPYSQKLFTSEKITLIHADITETIKTMNQNSFNNIVLDGGTPAHSNDFFSNENYRNAYRILRPKGRLYHYLPQPQSSKGRDFISEILLRLKRIGFSVLERNDTDSYAILYK